MYRGALGEQESLVVGVDQCELICYVSKCHVCSCSKGIFKSQNKSHLTYKTNKVDYMY